MIGTLFRLLISRGRIKLTPKVRCGYCGTYNGSESGMVSENRPYLDSNLELRCYDCNNPLGDSMCESCNQSINAKRFEDNAGPRP